jgi:hypothetical protein
MHMLLLIAVFLGLALIACMGLLRVLRELMDTKTSEEGAPPSEFCAADEVSRARGARANVKQ